MVGRFDLLLLDLGLPIKNDRWQVMQELRSKGDVLPIVIMTGDDSQCKAAASQAGTNDYITKSFLLNDLLERVRSQLAAAQKSTILR